MAASGTVNWCFDILAWILIAALCGYIFYNGFLMPMSIDIRNLRSNELSAIQMYHAHIDWHRYHVSEEQLSVVTYEQHIPFDYTFYIGYVLLLDASGNSSNQTDTINITEVENNSTLIDMDDYLWPMSWENFAALIEDEQHPDVNPTNHTQDLSLYFTMYSATDCRLPFDQCFAIHLHNQLIQTSDYMYYFTDVPNVSVIYADSSWLSVFLDPPRDTMVGLIMAIISVIGFFVVDSFDAWNRPWLAFVGAVACFGTYFLWILTLTYIPIYFALQLDAPRGYFYDLRYSLTFYIGDASWRSGALWWFMGVVLHGIWCFVLLLAYPCIGILLKLLTYFCSADKAWYRYAEKILYTFLFQVLNLFLITASLGFIIIFAKFLVVWNENTYKELSNMQSIQALIGVLTICVLLPVLMCLCKIWPHAEMEQLTDDAAHRVGVKTRTHSSSRYMSVSQVDAHHDHVDLDKGDADSMNEREESARSSEHQSAHERQQIAIAQENESEHGSECKQGTNVVVNGTFTRHRLQDDANAHSSRKTVNQRSQSPKIHSNQHLQPDGELVEEETKEMEACSHRAQRTFSSS